MKGKNEKKIKEFEEIDRKEIEEITNKKFILVIWPNSVGMVPLSLLVEKSLLLFYLEYFSLI